MGHSIPAGRGSISISGREFSNRARKSSRRVCGVADSDFSCREASQSSVWELRNSEGITDCLVILPENFLFDDEMS